MNGVRVFLADDHALVREGIKALINADPDMEVVGETADGKSAADAISRLQPDIVVMDISMPGASGAKVTEQLKQSSPHIKVLALTVHEDRGYIRQLFAAGASGYMLKRATAEELVHALRAVASGGTYLDPSLAGKVVDTLVSRPHGGKAIATRALSEREEEVVRLIAQGYSNKEIAARLGVGVKTVETYKARSLEKLGLRGRIDLVRHAVQQGWLEAD